MKQYLELFRVFCKVSLFTLGGGLAMLPFVEREVTEKRRWLSKDEFLDVFGMSQSMPGVMILNVATTVGYKIARTKGAVAAAAGTVLAPFISILLVAWFFIGVKDSPVAVKIFSGIRPAVMALITVPAITLSRAAKIRGAALLVPAAVALIIGIGRVHPAYVILAGSVIAFIRVLGARTS